MQAEVRFEDDLKETFNSGVFLRQIWYKDAE